MLGWKDLVFEEILMFIASALFCRLILNLIGPEFPYSSLSYCEEVAGFSTFFDCIIYLNFCLLIEISLNLCISNNIQEIKKFGQTTKSIYFCAIVYASIWYVAILMPFTILYTYFKGKNMYSSEEYNDFNECKKDWVMVWRYVACIPLLFGFCYPIIKMCFKKNFNNLKENRINNNNYIKNIRNGSKYLRLKRIAMKNFLYIVVFYISFVFSIVRGIYNVFGKISGDNDNNDNVAIPIEPPFFIACLSCLFESSYGLLNFIVYCHVVYVIDHKNNNDIGNPIPVTDQAVAGGSGNEIGIGISNIKEDDVFIKDQSDE